MMIARMTPIQSGTLRAERKGARSEFFMGRSRSPADAGDDLAGRDDDLGRAAEGFEGAGQPPRRGDGFAAGKKVPGEKGVASDLPDAGAALDGEDSPLVLASGELGHARTAGVICLMSTGKASAARTHRPAATNNECMVISMGAASGAIVRFGGGTRPTAHRLYMGARKEDC
jgi:hypothetical protein